MEIYSTYSVKIKHYNHIFKDTVSVYREAVDFLINVCLNEWEIIAEHNKHAQLVTMESLMHATSSRPYVKYSGFDRKFYKFPGYLRRAAIMEAIGKVSSYMSSLANWEAADPKTRGRKPSFPRAGYVFPCMYRGDMYKQTGMYEAQIKVYIRNTWDWITVRLRKSDVDYINRHCCDRHKCPPTLQKRGHEWFLDFPFEEDVKLAKKVVYDQTIVAVDLGINSAATVSVMQSDGAVLGRHFCKLPKEYDSLKHAINRIKKGTAAS